MQNKLMTIQNVRGYINNEGTACLNLEDIARGLGFTEIAASGNETIRWRTVRSHLSDLNFIATSCDGSDYVNEINADTFIPENIFYRLAMKAKNETAEKFQAKVADEILPSIRKHGAYMTPESIEKVLLNPDTIIQLATSLKEEQRRRMIAEHKVEQQKPKVLFADSVTASDTSILVGDLAKLIRQNGIDVGEIRLWQWMRSNEYAIKEKGRSYNMPTQKSMELGVMEVKEGTRIDSKGTSKITKTTMVTGKGQIYFINKFLEAKDKPNTVTV